MWLEPDDFPEFEIIRSRLIGFLLVTLVLFLLFLGLLLWFVSFYLP